jgi:hypothetical protein
MFPDDVATGFGDTAMLAGDPTIPVALKVIDCPAVVAVTAFVVAVGPRIRNVDAFPSEPVEADVAVRDPPPTVTAKITLTPLPTAFS